MHFWFVLFVHLVSLSINKLRLEYVNQYYQKAVVSGGSFFPVIGGALYYAIQFAYVSIACMYYHVPCTTNI